MNSLLGRLSQVIRVKSARDQTKYSAVDHDDKGYGGSRSASAPRKRLCLYPIVVVLCLGMVASAAFLSWAIFESRGRTSSAEILIKPCGENPEEARIRGCSFDIMSFCWLPPRCYDVELTDSFQQIARWEWFRDRNHTQSVPHDQVLAGDVTNLYVNMDYHIHHCAFMWKKLHRAIQSPHTKKAIDSYIASYSHTKHCADILTTGGIMEGMALNTLIYLKYPDCGME
jgi:hypothetical protein